MHLPMLLEAEYPGNTKPTLQSEAVTQSTIGWASAPSISKYGQWMAASNLHRISTEPSAFIHQACHCPSEKDRPFIPHKRICFKF